MLRNFRMRLAIWISPELAKMAEQGLAVGSAAMNNQMAANARHQQLVDKGIKGTVTDYDFWTGWYRTSMRINNERLAKTLFLPAPNTELSRGKPNE